MFQSLSNPTKASLSTDEMRLTERSRLMQAERWLKTPAGRDVMTLLPDKPPEPRQECHWAPQSGSSAFDRNSPRPSIDFGTEVNALVLVCACTQRLHQTQQSWQQLKQQKSTFNNQPYSIQLGQFPFWLEPQSSLCRTKLNKNIFFCRRHNLRCLYDT